LDCAVVARGKDAIKHGEAFLSLLRLSIGGHAVMASAKELPAEAKVAEKQDMKAAEESYDRFIVLFKWGTVLAAITTLLVVLIIGT
jgi:Bacterial aa3 type cytochrome c oxidase subunit IV